MVVEQTLSYVYAFGGKHTCVCMWVRPHRSELFLFFSFSFGGLPAAGAGGNVGALLSQILEESRSE